MVSSKSSSSRRLVPLLINRGFLESPRWHEGRLWCSDFWSREVIAIDERGQCERQAYIPGQPSGIGFSPDGTILVASTYDRALVGYTAGRRPHRVASTADVYAGGLNDMLVDSKGNAYISPFDADAPNSRKDADGYQASVPLLMVKDGKATRVAEGLEGPNGLALLQEANLLIVAETLGMRLTAFTVDDYGFLSGRRTFADLGGRAPDGISLDAERAIWAGCPFSNEIVRVADGGEVMEVIPTPGRWAVATALGGPDGRTLYCTTAVTTLGQFLDGKSLGAVEMTRVDVPAYGW